MAKITQEAAEEILTRNNIEVDDWNVRSVMTMAAMDLSEGFIVDTFKVNIEGGKSFSTQLLDRLRASGKTLLITLSQHEGEKPRVDVDLIDKDSAHNILSMGMNHSVGSMSYDGSGIVRSSGEDWKIDFGQHEGGSKSKH